MKTEPSVSALPVATVRQKSDTVVELNIRLHSEQDVFKGHFPEHPVLPGVVQLHWAASYAQEYFESLDVVVRIDALKFQNIIAPPAELILTLELLKGNSVGFSYSLNQSKASSGRIQFSEPSLL